MAEGAPPDRPELRARQEQLAEKLLSSCQAGWRRYTQLEQHALRSAIASGRAALATGRAAGASARHLVSTAQEVGEARAAEAAVRGKALTLRARDEYPEGLLVGAALAGASAGGSALSAAAAGGLAAVALGPSLGRKWSPPAGSFSWLTDAHADATRHLGTAVRSATSAARAGADHARARLETIHGAVVRWAENTEGGVKAGWRRLRGSCSQMSADVPEQIVAANCAGAWAAMSLRGGE
eukprot:scaffold6530_cov92-Isochrysis_galbana.AAC.2